jgi:hypothetical protein
MMTTFSEHRDVFGGTNELPTRQFDQSPPQEANHAQP